MDAGEAAAASAAALPVRYWTGVARAAAALTLFAGCFLALSLPFGVRPALAATAFAAGAGFSRPAGGTLALIGAAALLGAAASASGLAP